MSCEATPSSSPIIGAMSCSNNEATQSPSVSSGPDFFAPSPSSSSLPSSLSSQASSEGLAASVQKRKTLGAARAHPAAQRGLSGPPAKKSCAKSIIWSDEENRELCFAAFNVSKATKGRKMKAVCFFQLYLFPVLTSSIARSLVQDQRRDDAEPL